MNFKATRGLALAALLAGLAHPGDALATKTMREPLSARQVERGLVLPKGWLELDLGYDYKNGVGSWSDSDGGLFGKAQDFESAHWAYQTQYATLSYGLSHRWGLWWEVPFHEAHLTNDKLGTDIKDMSIGDPKFGATWLLLDQPSPRRQVAVEGVYKGPAGSESPGTYIGGPENMSSFVFSTGTPDLTLGLAAKQQLGPASVALHLDYVHRFGAVVQYLIEMENLQFSGRIKPGDQVVASLDVTLQAGPVAISAVPRFEHRAVTSIGTTAKAPFPNKNLDPVAGSDGNALDADLVVDVGLSRNVDLVGHYDLPVAGEDLQFFPIEDLQPTRGPTFGASVQFRY